MNACSANTVAMPIALTLETRFSNARRRIWTPLSHGSTGTDEPAHVRINTFGIDGHHRDDMHASDSGDDSGSSSDGADADKVGPSASRPSDADDMTASGILGNGNMGQSGNARAAAQGTAAPAREGQDGRMIGSIQAARMREEIDGEVESRRKSPRLET